MKGKLSIPYAGIQTFMGREFRKTLRGDENIVVLGIPLDAGTSYLPGARLGPSAIRRASMILKFYSKDSGLLDACTGEDILRDINIVDMGDLDVPFGDQAKSVKYIYENILPLFRSKAFKIFLGGDHSITYPIVKAAYTYHRDLHIIHIDSHLDILSSYAGNRYTHASPIYRIVNDLKFDPNKVYQLGVRGYITSKESYEYAKRIGENIYSVDEIRRRGVKEVLDEILDKIGKNKIYLTFDVDSLDPSIAPGTGVIEPGGLTYYEAREIMKIIGKSNVLAADFVEVSPLLDHNDITAKTVVYLIIDLISSMF